MIAAWHAVRAMARSLGLPQRFRGDLMHDRRALLRAKHQRVLWCAGPDGTFLAWLDCRAPGRSTSLADTVHSMFPAALLWDGADLRPVATTEEMRELLASEAPPSQAAA
jgi:bifunctional pyridoxal-dependent enzyme with beta-cystathionase and maltose regulon repressor activities